MKQLITATLGLLLITGLTAQTTVPTLMNYQGRLTKPDGTPVPDGTYAITFRIKDAPVGGNTRWEQTMDPVLVRNGVFAVLLGNGNPLSQAAFGSEAYP
jgi:hypothetical protein